MLPRIERWKFIEDSYGWDLYDEKEIYTSYQDSTRLCFTKNLEPGSGRNHTYDICAMNDEHISFTIEVYLHKPGGLIQQPGKKYVFQMTGRAIQVLFKNSEQGITVFHDMHLRSIQVCCSFWPSGQWSCCESTYQAYLSNPAPARQ